MGDMVITKFHDSEISKSDDFNFTSESSVDVLSDFLDASFRDVVNSFVVTGMYATQLASPSMNVTIKPGLVFSRAEERLLHLGSDLNVEVGEADPALNRLDTLEIRRAVLDFNSEPRAFKDPFSGQVTYTPVNTRTKVFIEARCLAGTPGSGVAPAAEFGWVKIAEILVSAATTTIINSNIRNVTAQEDGLQNAAWTAEQDSVFYLGSVESLKNTVIAHMANNITSANTVHGIRQGSGNGFDSDLLDGRHAGNLSGNIPISNAILSVDLDADFLDGQHGAYYRDAANLNAGYIPQARLQATDIRYLFSTVTPRIKGALEISDAGTVEALTAPLKISADGAGVGWIGLAADSDLLKIQSNLLTISGDLYLGGTTRYIGLTGDTDLLKLEAGKLTVNGSQFGIILEGRNTWDLGPTYYPVLRSTYADEWVFLHHPHIPYLQNGSGGYAGVTVGARIRFATNATASNYWDIGCLSYGTSGYFQFGYNGVAKCSISAGGEISAPTFYTSSYYTAEGDNDIGIGIRYPNNAIAYGRIRFYQSGANHNTIHSFADNWDNTTIERSAGALNFQGSKGVTIGLWTGPDAVFRKGGTFTLYRDMEINNGNNAILYFSPNTTYGAGLMIGSYINVTIPSTHASIQSSNGNLHIDSRVTASYKLYLNYFTVGDIAMCAGASQGGVAIGTDNPAGYKLYVAGSIYGSTVWGAVGNDYADCLPFSGESVQAGYVVSLIGGKQVKASRRNDPSALGIISDTFSFRAGDKDNLSNPIAVSGFVLAYVDSEYETGTPLTVDNDGRLTMAYDGETVIAKYTSRIDTETWNSVKANGRHLVKVV